MLKSQHIGPDAQFDETLSSIHVYLFLQHAVQIFSTWMRSCMQFEKTEG